METADSLCLSRGKIVNGYGYDSTEMNFICPKTNSVKLLKNSVNLTTLYSESGFQVVLEKEAELITQFMKLLLRPVVSVIYLSELLWSAFFLSSAGC